VSPTFSAADSFWSWGSLTDPLTNKTFISNVKCDGALDVNLKRQKSLTGRFEEQSNGTEFDGLKSSSLWLFCFYNHNFICSVGIFKLLYYLLNWYNGNQFCTLFNNNLIWEMMLLFLVKRRQSNGLTVASSIFMQNAMFSLFRYFASMVRSRVVQSVQWLATDWATGVRSPAEAEDFYFTLFAQPALGPTQPSVQWIQGIPYPRVKDGRVVMLTTHPLLVPRLRKRGAIPPLTPKRLAWRVAGLACVFLWSHTLKIQFRIDNLWERAEFRQRRRCRHFRKFIEETAA
jgi:hypothetical protein